MHYDTIILGATFTAAGIAAERPDSCLILDRRPHAGYEFINALSFGTGYEMPPRSDRAILLKAELQKRGVFSDGTLNLFPCAPALYQLLERCNVLLNMELLSVTLENGLFTVTAHGVSGYRTFHARKVIDTRTAADQVHSKSLNVLINCDDGSIPVLPSEVITEKWGFPNDLVVKCAVAPEADYIQARKAVADLIRTLPEGCRAALVADCFDCSLKDNRLAESNGITYLPSKQFANPILAFDAGVLYAQGGSL